MSIILIYNLAKNQSLRNKNKYFSKIETSLFIYDFFFSLSSLFAFSNLLHL